MFTRFPMSFKQAVSVVCLFQLFWGSLGSVGWAEHPNVDHIRRLKQQSQSLEARSAMLRQKKMEKLRAAHYLNNHIAQNQIKLEETERSLHGQQVRLVQTKSRLIYLADKMDRTLGEATRMAVNAGERLRGLYTGERVSFLQMILDSNDIATLLDRLYYKQKIVAQDKKLLADLREKTQELNLQKQVLAIQKHQIAGTIQTIHTYKLQISDRIEADRVLRDKYQNDALYYQQAERQLLVESASIRQQILSMTRRARNTAVAIVKSTGIFSMPIFGAITSTFGYRTHPIHRVRMMHTGLDISGPNRGSVRAADSGQVIYAGWRGGYGKVVMINHGERNGVNLVTLYGHLSGWAVGPGDAVGKGQVIGYEGSTGFSTGPHVHFEIRENGSPVDPYRYLR